MAAHQALTSTRTDPVAWLKGRRLLLARSAWVVAALLALAIVAAGIPPRLAALQTVSSPRIPQQLRPWELRLFQQSGLGVLFYAAYSTAMEALSSLVWVGVAAVLYWRRSADRMALVAAFTLVAFAASMNGFPDTLAASAHGWRLPLQSINVVGMTAVTVLCYLFPNGRFVPRWTRRFALVVLPAYAALYLDPSLSPKASLPGLFLMALLYGSGVLAQIYRYRRVSSQVERQQTKWVVFAVAGMIAGLLTLILVYEISAAVFASNAPGYVTTFVVGYTVFTACKVLIPISLAIAILRYRLWDIDLIINRTLVYGALTASVVGLYVLMVGGLGEILQTHGNLAISLLATGLVAILFQPLRTRLQHGVNRLLYGERDEPYAVLSRLGQRLEGTLAPGSVLSTVVETVAQALKLPYAAIEIREGAAWEVAAAYGTPTEGLATLPLVYQSETVGRLTLAARTGESALSPIDRRLLDDLARQAGIAVHAVRLTADLQRSRERLVATREEERRRLRRDLHDGLGPALASMTLQAEAARDLAHGEPRQTENLLTDLIEQLQLATADIRRLVYELRPPALDELGLVPALRTHAARRDQSGVRITVDAPERLPSLPAAVEVAAYRIVQEALTNVVRHADAHTCTIRLAMDDAMGALCVEICDDGRGLPQGAQAGVGLISMRERAEELGGTCAVRPSSAGGVCILAQLPLMNTAAHLPAEERKDAHGLAGG